MKVLTLALALGLTTGVDMADEPKACNVGIDYDPAPPEYGSIAYLHNHGDSPILARVRVTGYTAGPSESNYRVASWDRALLGYTMERGQRFTYEVVACKQE